MRRSARCCAGAPALATDEAGYWAFADQVQRRLDDDWSPKLDQYRVGSPSVDTMLNANELLVHSAAALRGLDASHPVRADARARSITAALMRTPPWIESVTDPAAGSQPHSPGWVASMQLLKSSQHLVVDGEVTDALAMAWLARDAIGLDNATRALLVDRLRRVALGPYWRYPTLRLNQINWYAEVYMAATTATSDLSYLQRDFRGQLLAVHPQHPLPGEGHGRDARPGHAVPLHAGRPAAIAAQRRLGRVREHRRLDAPLLRHRGRASGCGRWRARTRR